MRARGAFLLAVGGGAVAAACAPHADGPKPAVAAHAPPEVSDGPVYRFVMTPPYGLSAVRVDADHVAGYLGGERILMSRDGSVERAPGVGMSGGPVPEHLGGGFVFWSSDAVYRARTFTGALEPFARINGNAIGVEYGPSSVLVFTEEAPPHAYALEPGRPVPVSPHGVLEIAAADAERALAFDAAGRSLATIDGGRSWQDVGAKLGESPSEIRREGSDVGFVLGGPVGAWLQKHGGFARRPLPDANGKPAEKSPERKASELLTGAVASGLPLSRTHALTAREAGVFDVDLVTGEAKVVAPKIPFGIACAPVSLEEEGVFVCFDPTMHTSAVVSHALSKSPKVEKELERSPSSERSPYVLSDELLVMEGSCSGKWVDGVACVRSLARAGNGAAGQGSEPAKWVEVTVQAALGDTWQVLRWVPKGKGGAAALVLEREERVRERNDGKSPRVALIDGVTRAITGFDALWGEVAPQGLGRAARNLVVREDGTLRGFTATSELSVDAKGHVAKPTRTFINVVNAGALALAEDDAARLWQTKDYGEHWVEVARPPFERQRPPVAAGPHRGGAVRRSINCSLVGCVIAHETGMGNWLRLGWPLDPPRPAERPEDANAAKAKANPPLVVPDFRPIPPRPKLRCTASNASGTSSASSTPSTSGASGIPIPSIAPTKPGRPLLTLGVKKPVTPKPATKKPAAAKPVAAKPPAAKPVTEKPAIPKKRVIPETEANLPFGDVFVTDDPVMTYGLRGLVHVRPTAWDGSFQLLAASKAPFEVELLEPFDRAGHVVRATGSLAAWTRLLKEKKPPDPRDWNPDFQSGEGKARPVLGAAPGHADGALFVNGDFSFWVSHTGKIRPIETGCRADSGYVDAKGALFVACGGFTGRTRLVDVEHGRTLFQVPLTERFRGDSGPGMAYFAPGQQLLANPDAVAVGPDGKLGIVRIASGSEPPTVDIPAWLLTADGPPVELAPWTSLELASSPACANAEGYRALIQVAPPWIEVEGAQLTKLAPGMSAIVRWSTERVCLEALEIGRNSGWSDRVMIVADFTAKKVKAAFVGTSTTASVREAATCELVASP